MNYIAIDNGVSGSVALVKSNGKAFYQKTPTRKELNYTKRRRYINRIDFDKMYAILESFYGECLGQVRCLVERPMVNPQRFLASLSAVRSLEATLLVLEKLKIPYWFIDSKQWQRSMLPAGFLRTRGFKINKSELKEASLIIGRRMFPQLVTDKMKDCDSLLLAEWGRRSKF